MKRQQKKESCVVRSKYFSIDAYFKSTANDSKRLKSTQEEQVEKTIQLQEEKKEQCPLCNAWILTESLSLEVHVNQCLDKEQKENQAPHDAIQQETISSSSISSCHFSIKADSDNAEQPSSNSVDSLPVSTCEDTQSSTSDSVQPSAWKSLFSASSSSKNLSVASASTTTTSSSSLSLSFIASTTSNRAKKPCPFYKWVKDTQFVVDAFKYGKIPNCDGYFLTHFHSDHYGGLTGKWSHGPIYCSQVTANLVKQELRVDSRYVHPLPMNQLYPIPGSTVQVALIDANHCPGSVLFLFVMGNNKRHLHTGDFRAAPRMCLHPLIRQPENPSISSLYLDTTYLSPQYAFPAQEECIKAVCHVVNQELNQKKEEQKPSLLERWISKREEPAAKEEDVHDPMIKNNAFQLMMGSNKTAPRVLIVVGTYTIGKERVFINIARMLKCKIYAPTKKKRILLCQEDEELKSMLTNNATEAQVHVVPLRDIRADIMSKYLHEYKAHFSSLIAFKPTGWTYKSTSSQTTDMKLAPLSHIIIPPTDRTVRLEPFYKNANVKLYGVPYSEHSSFRELASFVASLNVHQIIPTVNISQLPLMSTYFEKWEEEKLSKRTEVVKYVSEDYW